jgi:hypothetical protein
MSTSLQASGSLQADVEVTPDQSQAQQMAASELANPKYHNLPAAQSSVTALPTIGAPTTPPPPPPPPSSTTSSNPTVILVIVGAIVLVLVLVLVLRTIGKPRAEKDKKAKKKKPKSESAASEAAVFDEELFGAALAFDEVEYGQYLGSSEGYARIRAVDEQIAAAVGHGLPVVRR